MKTLIIAEAGVNHNGDYHIAEKMIEEAYKAGADIIKFQTAKPELVISKYAEKAEYQKENTKDRNESQLEMCKKIHLPLEAYKLLKNKCESIGIEFLSTPFDLESIDVLHNIGMKIWKIPSGEVTNLPYLVKIASYHDPIIMSTGMCTLDEIEEAIKVLKKNGAGSISLLHCTTEYPTPYEEVNLKAMNSLKKKFGVDVGYSDHTTGIEVSIAAVAMGATIIEKHFTLDRNMNGPDHKASIEPDELKHMVISIHNIEKAIGDGNKKVTESERKNIIIARKSIVASKDIKKGEVLSESNITTKRPGNGISPMKWFDIIGKTAIRDFKEDELIEL